MYSLQLAATTLGDKIDSIFYDFDIWVFHLFGSIQNSFFTFMAKAFSTFGNKTFVVPMVLLFIVFCFFKKTRKYCLSFIFAFAIGTVLTLVLLKPTILRVRPYNTLQNIKDYWNWYLGAGHLCEHDYSFPSGHTTIAFETAVSLALVFRKEKKKKFYYILITLAFCTMCSRVYLMIHYASDVIGGLIVGTAAGIAGYFISIFTCKLFEKNKILNSIDADKFFKKLWKKPNYIINRTAIYVVFFAIFCSVFIGSLSEGGENVLRCAYSDKYNCQNAAKHNSDKYPPIDGKEYCEIHWKKITEENSQ